MKNLFFIFFDLFIKHARSRWTWNFLINCLRSIRKSVHLFLLENTCNRKLSYFQCISYHFAEFYSYHLSEWPERKNKYHSAFKNRNIITIYTYHSLWRGITTKVCVLNTIFLFPFEKKCGAITTIFLCKKKPRLSGFSYWQLLNKLNGKIFTLLEKSWVELAVVESDNCFYWPMKFL